MMLKLKNYLMLIHIQSTILEADLNGKTKEDIISKVSAIFRSNNAQSHFEKYWIVSNEE